MAFFLMGQLVDILNSIRDIKKCYRGLVSLILITTKTTFKDLQKPYTSRDSNTLSSSILITIFLLKSHNKLGIMFKLFEYRLNEFGNRDKTHFTIVFLCFVSTWNRVI